MLCKKSSKKKNEDQNVETTSAWYAQYKLKSNLFDEKKTEYKTADEYGLIKGEKKDKY